MKRKVKELNTCNQFCGAGGCEIGIRDGIVKDMGKVFKGVAINHWSRAVETMKANSQPVSGTEDIARVATVSAGDEYAFARSVKILIYNNLLLSR